MKIQVRALLLKQAEFLTGKSVPGTDYKGVALESRDNPVLLTQGQCSQ